MNAAAALVAAEKSDHMKDGVALAGKSIDSGAAMKKLESLVQFSRSRWSKL
jgi:anthranilate phosphoribosyltransferase